MITKPNDKFLSSNLPIHLVRELLLSIKLLLRPWRRRGYYLRTLDQHKEWGWKSRSCMTKLRFGTKSQSNIFFHSLDIQMIVKIPSFQRKSLKSESEKPWVYQGGLPLTEATKTWIFFISRWSIAPHTSAAAWGECCSTLEDIVALNGSPVFGEPRTIITWRCCGGSLRWGG